MLTIRQYRTLKRLAKGRRAVASLPRRRRDLRFRWWDILTIPEEGCFDEILRNLHA